MKLKEKVEKFKSSKVGVWLKEKAPKVLDVVDDYFPPAKLLTALIDQDPDVKPEDKLEWQKLVNDYELEKLRIEQSSEKELTERAKIDMASDSWLSKNIRPIMLIFLALISTILAIIDSASFDFNVPEDWVTLYTYAFLCALSYYFVGREVQKFILNRKK